MIRINVAFLQIALKIFGSKKKRESATLICSRKKIEFSHFYITLTLSKILFLPSMLPFYFQEYVQIRSDQLLSPVPLFATPRITARQASLSITNSRSSFRPTSIESVMPSSHLILCRPLLLLPPIPPSIRVFSLFFSHLDKKHVYSSTSFSQLNTVKILAKYRQNEVPDPHI